jgi:hypothetical protein
MQQEYFISFPLFFFLEKHKVGILVIFTTIQSRTTLFSPADEKRKNLNMKDYSFACSSVWVWNSVFDINGGTQTEGMRFKIFTAVTVKNVVFWDVMP